MSNLELWDNLRTPPPGATKPITGGRLNGKSDISPIWRMKALTEQFGPCGVGWKFEVVNTWIVDGSEGQKMLYMQVHLFTKKDNEWSAPIPGFGGDFLIEKERGGLHSNDEAFKMAETDAMGNAMKKLGVAADVYWEKGRETKYDKPAQTITGNANQPAPQPPQPTQINGSPKCTVCGKGITKQRAEAIGMCVGCEAKGKVKTA